MGEKMRDRASKGGRARAAKLTAEQRRQIGIAGSLARWGKTLPEAQYGSSDQPLRIGSVEIPCYVLEDGRRVLVQDGMMAALDLEPRTARSGADDRLSELVQTPSVAEFGAGDLGKLVGNPVLFRAEGTTAYGYEATLLADLCEAVMAARDTGHLKRRHWRIADQCELLFRAFARVGINALVDEATGIAATRTRDELATMLEAFVQTELKQWVRTFPEPYYEGLYRLRELAYPPEDSGMPAALGGLTNDIVYDRLPPRAKNELERRAPSTGRRRKSAARNRSDAGEAESPRLREHLGAVVALMRISKTYREFEAHLDTALPRWEAGGGSDDDG